MVALLISKATLFFTWILPIGISLYLGFPKPEPKPDPYADLGMVCIAIVFVGATCFFLKQVRKIYLIRKSMKEV